MSNTNVKLIYINGAGPIIGIIQEESTDSITVKNPCQIGTDENNQLVIRDYLDGIVNPNENTIFMKYNIVSVNVPADYLSTVYVETIKAIEEANNPKIIVPEQKIIL